MGDSVAVGTVRNVHNLLSYGVVGKSVCRMWESCTLAFHKITCLMGKYISYLLSLYNKNTEKRNLLQFKCKRFLKLMTL